MTTFERLKLAKFLEHRPQHVPKLNVGQNVLDASFPEWTEWIFDVAGAFTGIQDVSCRKEILLALGHIADGDTLKILMKKMREYKPVTYELSLPVPALVRLVQAVEEVYITEFVKIELKQAVHEMKCRDGERPSI